MLRNFYIEYFSTFGGDFAPIVVRIVGLVAVLVALFDCLTGNTAGWLIKTFKQNVVITSCCNIVLFCRVNAQHQFLLLIKLSDAVLSCCFVVLFG